jgi:hypothetical protein
VVALFNPALFAAVDEVNAVAVGRTNDKFSTPEIDAVLKLVPVLANVALRVSVPSPPSITNWLEPAEVSVNESLPEPPVKESAPPAPVTVNAVPVDEAAVAARTPAKPEALTEVTAEFRAVVPPARRFKPTPAAPPVIVSAGMTTALRPSVAAAADAEIAIDSTPATADKVALVPATFARETLTESLAVFAARENDAVAEV